MPSKWLLELKEGAVVKVELAGGGGYGNPYERDLDAVASDVRQGKLTAGYAREKYAVVFHPGSMEPDLEATVRLRQSQPTT